MSDYKPEVGHRVAWRGEGTVVEIKADIGHVIVVGNTEGADHIPWTHTLHWATEFERLPDPEPEWQPGDVVGAPYGLTLVRRNASVQLGSVQFEWRNAVTEEVYRDTEVGRPLIPLVRNGKPWSES